jgi:hypothetical protein
MAQHGRMGKDSTFPILTAAEKQPKPKKQTPPQPKDGMGKLRNHPSPQKEKTEVCDCFLRSKQLKSD